MWLKTGPVLYRNTWRQSEVTDGVPKLPADGSIVPCPAMWSSFLERMFCSVTTGGDDKTKEPVSDQMRFIKEFELWLAFSLFSNRRPKWSPVLRGEHGTGKGTISDHIIQPFVGKSNHIKVLPHNIKGDHGAQFLTEKCMVVFDEVNDRGAVFYDRLKNMTTESELAVNPKNLAPYVDDAVFSTLILSNEEVPMGYPEGERRWLVSPYMTHHVSPEETGDWLYKLFVPWLHSCGYKELGLYLKYLVASEELPAVAWKSLWFFETCKTDTNDDHATAILSWLDEQCDEFGYTVTGLSNHFKAGNGVVRSCLEAAGYVRGKINGTNINVYKKKGRNGTLHHKCAKTDGSGF
jgi:hypothetical protein